MERLLLLSDQTVTKQIVIDLLSNIVGVTFGYAAAAKLASLSGLVAAIRGFELLPSRFARTAAVALIACEAAIALFHVAGVAMLIVAPATLLLLSLFLVVSTNVLRRGEKRPCLCFGANADRVDGYSLVRLGLLFVAELVLYSFHLFYSAGVPRAGSPMDAILYGLLIVSIGSLAVMLLGWCFAVPKLFSARAVLDV